jgi:hypothetical protein
MNSPAVLYLVPVAALGVGAAGGWFTAPRNRAADLSAKSTVEVRAVRESEEQSLTRAPILPASEKQPSVDPSLETAMKYPSALHRRVAMKRYFEALDLALFDEVFSKVRTIGETEPEVLDLFARVWAERAPEAGARTLLTLRAGPQRSKSLAAFARAWGRRDAAAASAWAEKVFTGQDLEQVRYYLKGKVAQQTLEKPKSFAEIMAIPGRDERQTELSKYLWKMAETDPEKALQQASEIAIKNDRRNAQLTVTSTWARKDPLALLQWLKNLDSKSHWTGTEWTEWTVALSSASSELMAKDLNQLRQLIDGWRQGPLKNTLATEYASTLVQRDPEAAISFVEEMKLRDPDFSAASILPSLLDKNPERGKELLRAEIDKLVSKNSQEPGEYSANMMQKWIEKDAGAAAEFAKSLPAKVMPDVFYAISKEWCLKDGQAALGWAASLPAGEAKEHAYRQFTYTWAKHDTKKSTSWLNSLPQDEHRWAATEGFVFSTFDTDPDAALGWARSIPDEKKRLDILARAWSAWNRSNSQSADDWLQHGELSEQEREAILK